MTITIPNLPDAEAEISAFLRGLDEIFDLVEERVYTEIPANAEFPLVRLTRIGGTPLFNKPLWVDRPTLQIEAYGGTKAQAQEIAETCRAALSEIESATSPTAVFLSAEFGGMLYLPDPEFKNPRPRYVFDVDVFLHSTELPLS